eukprot:6193521-Pleurochrysis_carterae.AAC.2
MKQGAPRARDTRFDPLSQKVRHGHPAHRNVLVYRLFVCLLLTTFLVDPRSRGPARCSHA